MADRVYAYGDRVQPVNCDWEVHGVVAGYKPEDDEYRVAWDDGVGGWHRPRYLAPEEGCIMHEDCRQSVALSRACWRSSLERKRMTPQVSIDQKGNP